MRSNQLEFRTQPVVLDRSPNSAESKHQWLSALAHYFENEA